VPSIYATPAHKAAYFAAYRQRNRIKLRAYKREWQRAYRAAGRDKSRAGKVGVESNLTAKKD
jgi:hypothetical protein